MRKNAAIGVIFNEDRSQVLLVKRCDVPVWVLPGGGVESGESSSETVIREILEETGLHVKVMRKVAEYTPINKLASFTEIYECSAIAGHLTKGSETDAISFFPINQSPKNFFFLHEEWLQDAIRNIPEIIKRPLDDVTYWNFAKYFLRHPTWVIRFLFTLTKKDN